MTGNCWSKSEMKRGRPWTKVFLDAKVARYKSSLLRKQSFLKRGGCKTKPFSVRVWSQNQQPSDPTFSGPGAMAVTLFCSLHRDARARGREFLQFRCRAFLEGPRSQPKSFLSPIWKRHQSAPGTTFNKIGRIQPYYYHTTPIRHEVQF